MLGAMKIRHLIYRSRTLIKSHSQYSALDLMADVWAIIARVWNVNLVINASIRSDSTPHHGEHAAQFLLHWQNNGPSGRPSAIAKLLIGSIRAPLMTGLTTQNLWGTEVWS